MRKCLYCYHALTDGHEDFHPACSKKIFGLTAPPTLAYSEDDLERLAREVIQSQTSVTGVQAKLSLHITSDSKEAKTKRFTIVGLWGGYILKPPTTRYPQLPEVEDLTMRIDRVDQRKLAMEDMCQLTERMTEK